MLKKKVQKKKKKKKLAVETGYEASELLGRITCILILNSIVLLSEKANLPRLLGTTTYICLHTKTASLNIEIIDTTLVIGKESY